MSDEPSNWELARSLNDIKLMLAGLVSHAQYDSDERNRLYRFDELGRDIADERRDREKAIKAINDRIDAHEQKGASHREHWRTLLYTGMLPAAVAAVIGILTLYFTLRGGH